MDKKDLENRNQIILLIDIYGELLTEKQKRILELYFLTIYRWSKFLKLITRVDNQFCIQ